MSLAERLISHHAASASGLVQQARQCRPRQHGACGGLWPHSSQRRQRSLTACADRSHDGPAPIAASPAVADAPKQLLQQEQQPEQHPDAAPHVKTRYIAETLLPTRHGKFRLRGYKHSLDGGVTFTEPTAIICGQVEGRADVPLRVHDACFTSEVLGSLKCDCAEQLELALDYIQEAGCGMVIYLQQEGRGIGLANKIAAYALQEQGLDTVDANRALGLPDDCREYTSVCNILRDLGITSVQLMTNNPRKLDVLTQLGVTITGRIPCLVQAGEYNKGYLAAKRERMDHLLDGSWCWVNHEGEPMQPTAAAADGSGMGLPPGLRAATDTLPTIPPSLASHTVELDEEGEASSSGSSSSSSAFAMPAVARNGSSLSSGSSSSSSSSSSGGDTRMRDSS